ncbi:MAG TPA: hypothetical protein VF323_02070 [Candidatus Limnocylindrales bacterium]
MPSRSAPPGPSYIREHELRVHERSFRAGMGRPSEPDGGWWVALLWVADDDGLVTFRDAGPLAGPPPGPPAARLGPSLAGSLSGMILEEDGRLQLKVAPVAPPPDPARPWDAPLVVLVGIRFEPLRAAATGASALADAVLAGFRRSVEALARP